MAEEVRGVIDLAEILGVAPDPTPATDPLAEVEALERELAIREAADLADLERELLRRDLGAFVAWAWPLITGAPFAANEITTKIIGALQRVADSEATRVLIACPPGVGKSTLLACYAAWRLARSAGHRAIHAGHAYELAATESRRVRRFVEGDDYRRMFPSVLLRDDENRADHWATIADGRYFAVGVGGALTGRRAHEAVLDDPLNAIDRFSKAARDTLWSWFQESLSTRLDGDRAPIVVVQQRLDRDDLIGRLLEVGGWELVECPAEDDDGTLLAPNVLPREKLDAVKATIGAAAYATQYKQRPADDASAAIARRWWRFHRPAHVAEHAPRPAACDTDVPAVATPSRFDRIVIAADLTFGGVKKANDLACISVWGRVGSARYLLEVWWKRATQLVQRDAIKELKRRYRSAKIVVEKAAAGAGVLELLAADGIDAIGVVPLGSKAERLDLVSPAIEAGNCFLPLGAPWLADFVEELAGATKHDDAQDSTSLALADLAATTSREWPEIRRERERAEKIAAGEKLEPDVPLYARLMSALYGITVAVPGTTRDIATGKILTGCEGGHTWVDARCRKCGAPSR